MHASQPDCVFGRFVNGPLRLIQQRLLTDDVLNGVQTTNLIDFVLNLRERICSSVLLANETSLAAQSKSIRNGTIDHRCAKTVAFETGQQVLLLLPLLGKPLQAIYCS